MELMEKNPKSYKESLNLPTTTLSIRAAMGEREPELRAYWNENGVEQEFFAGSGAPFVLHDGPPYANGHLHVGHALNKILKDIIVRSQRMLGRAVQFAPGWDCHGLPIELKVAAASGKRLTDPVGFKKECREYVKQWQAIQEEEFKELGVFAEWDKRYLTMDPSYEASIITSLATFVEKGYVERKGKTVPWCFSCQTVLATAEIEYADRKDPSCYILFPVVGDAHLLSGIRTLSFLIWTTTPWTIPLNRAVVLHPDAQYAIVALDETRAVVVGAELVSSLAEILGAGSTVLCIVTSTHLIGMSVRNPLVAEIVVPVIGDESVSTSDGTACLHSAPGCGPDDYLMGVKNGLEIFSPLSADGRYTEEILPASLSGMLITDGQWVVLKELQEKGFLLHKSSIKHSYPHCWRCQNGLMFRATEQWFCNLAKNNLIARAQEVVNDIAFVPSWGKNRLDAFLSHRTEWCISRQRSWGVPIPALYNTQTGQCILSASFMCAVAAKVAVEGVEYWDRVTIAELRAEGMLPEECVAMADDDLTKEKDILDVWFDSGVSHTAVIAAREGVLPVDVYVEGSDQHRGWFQSSLLCSVIMHNKPQAKKIVTHGFVVDANGHKMSKSRGNVVDPKMVLKKYGADVLRLWVASVDYERDVVISDNLLTQTAEVYRKIRNTCRFLLSNLYDFNPDTDCVAFDDMQLLDRYAVSQVTTTLKLVTQWYGEYAFASIVQALARYCSVELSAHYLDMSKDRLYVEHATSQCRRSAQTAQYYILTALNQMIAPLMPFTAEDVFLAVPYQKTTSSIHTQLFSALPAAEAGAAELWQSLHTLRDDVLQKIEKLRVNGEIKQSLEAAVCIEYSNTDEWYAVSSLLKNQSLESFFKEWFIVSQCSIAATKSDKTVVTVKKAEGSKCPRCWHWEIVVHQEGICTRCSHVLEKSGGI
jgi:isoleucyl-tRNA synthetase